MANVAKIKNKKLKLVHSEKTVLFNHMRMMFQASRTSLFKKKKKKKKKNTCMSRNPKRFAEASSQLQVMPKKKKKAEPDRRGGGGEGGERQIKNQQAKCERVEMIP